VKIAFVNQPGDIILPPYQTSIGACTYGAACALSQCCDIVVYGTRDRHKDFPTDFWDKNVHFQFFPVSWFDRRLAKAKEKYSKFFPIGSPPSTSTWLFQNFGRQVAEDLRSQACDVVHVQHCSQFVPVIRALNPGAKIVLQLHAEWFSQTRPAILERRLRDVDLVTAVSNHIAEKTRRQFPMIATRCRTIYNGIDTAEFRREKPSYAPQRQEKRILYAGAVSPHKGLHVLMDAFSIVVEKDPEARLDVVGWLGNYPLAEAFDVQEQKLIESVYPFYAFDWISRIKAKLSLAPADAGTYLAHLKARLSPEASSKVTFLGIVPRAELIDRYYNADVFAFAPIWDEGFGIPPAEAMAAGTPVVASRSGAVPEIVKDQETGFLVGKNDPGALAEGILKLLHDAALRERMGRAARNWVHENFIWGRIAETMFTCYSDLCGSGAVKAAIGAAAGDPLVAGHNIEGEAGRTFLSRGRSGAERADARSAEERYNCDQAPARGRYTMLKAPRLPL
jgi:glycosyltransferase involved in cell wall biosynthesis